MIEYIKFWMAEAIAPLVIIGSIAIILVFLSGILLGILNCIEFARDLRNWRKWK